jgi:hypothetical protein
LLRCGAEQMWLRRKRSHWPGHDRWQVLVDVGRKGAHAGRPTATAMMSRGGKGVVVVVGGVLLRRFVGVPYVHAHVMAHAVGMSETVEQVLAVSECEQGRGQRKANCREDGKRQRKPKANPSVERGWHGFRGS